MERPTRAAHCAALAFPSLRRFLTRRTCLLATGKNSDPSARTRGKILPHFERLKG
jgi:hypothetical protein